MQCRMSFFIFMKDSLATMYSKSYLIIFYLGILCYIYKSLHSFIYILSTYEKTNPIFYMNPSPQKIIDRKKAWFMNSITVCESGTTLIYLYAEFMA